MAGPLDFLGIFGDAAGGMMGPEMGAMMQDPQGFSQMMSRIGVPPPTGRGAPGMVPPPNADFGQMAPDMQALSKMMQPGQFDISGNIVSPGGQVLQPPQAQQPFNQPLPGVGTTRGIDAPKPVQPNPDNNIPANVVAERFPRPEEQPPDITNEAVRGRFPTAQEGFGPPEALRNPQIRQDTIPSANRPNPTSPEAVNPTRGGRAGAPTVERNFPKEEIPAGDMTDTSRLQQSGMISGAGTPEGELPDNPDFKAQDPGAKNKDLMARLQAAFRGIKAPENPKVPMPSTPGAPRPSGTINPMEANAIIRMMFGGGALGQGQGGGTLASLLGGR